MKSALIIGTLALIFTSTVHANAALTYEDLFSNSKISTTTAPVRALNTCSAEIAKIRSSTQKSLMESSVEIADLRWVRLKMNPESETNAAQATDKIDAIAAIDLRIQQLQDFQVATFNQSQELIRVIQDNCNN